MVWAKFDDTWGEEPAIIELSDAAHRAYVDSVLYVSRHSTDGALPKAAARGGPKIARELVRANLWAVDGPGWLVIQWPRHTPSRAELDNRRAATAKRIRKWREERGLDP